MRQQCYGCQIQYCYHVLDPLRAPVFPSLSVSLSLSALGPAEARRPADPARGPGRGEPDAGAVRQDGGRQHQNEALDGGDLCAFNRQRQAVVQVEVTSFSLSSSSPPLSFSQWQR